MSDSNNTQIAAQLIRKAANYFEDADRAALHQRHVFIEAGQLATASAQAVATVALVEELRTANLIAWMGTEQRGNTYGVRMENEINERLGLTK